MGSIAITDKSANQVVTLSSTSTKTALDVAILGSLVPTSHDYIALSYTGSNLTGVVYKSGGSTGTVVATLTLAYSGSNLVSVTRT